MIMKLVADDVEERSTLNRKGLFGRSLKQNELAFIVNVLPINLNLDKIIGK